MVKNTSIYICKFYDGKQLLTSSLTELYNNYIQYSNEPITYNIFKNKIINDKKFHKINYDDYFKNKIDTGNMDIDDYIKLRWGDYCEKVEKREQLLKNKLVVKNNNKRKIEMSGFKKKFKLALKQKIKNVYINEKNIIDNNVITIDRLYNGKINSFSNINIVLPN